MRRFLLACLFMVGSVAIHAKKDPPPVPEEKPYVWPDLPTAQELEKAKRLPAPNGLVVLERKMSARVGGGTSKDDFVRILVVSEEGAGHASFSFSPGQFFEVKKLEGRTLPPGGGAPIPLEDSRDIKKIEATFLEGGDPLYTSLKVAFPAPTVGAILDLHYVVDDRYGVGLDFGFGTFIFRLLARYSSFVEPIPFGSLSTLKSEFRLTACGLSSGSRWHLITCGDKGGVCSISSPSEGEYLVKVGPISVEREPKAAPPQSQRIPTILCYLFEIDDEIPADWPKPSKAVLSVGPKGHVQGISFSEKDAVGLWWIHKIREQLDEAREFLSKPGKAKYDELQELAPAALSVPERVCRLYDHAQKTMSKNPDGWGGESLADAIRNGAGDGDQVSLYFKYLLDRAGIPNTLLFVSDRGTPQFSPFIRSASLYGFVLGVQVDATGLVYLPGEAGLDCGALPVDRQEALVLSFASAGELLPSYTGNGEAGADLWMQEAIFDLDFTGNGKGKSSITATGSRSFPFRNWWAGKRRLQERKDRATLKKEDPAELQAKMSSKLAGLLPPLPAGLTLQGLELAKEDGRASAPLRIQAEAQFKRLGRASGPQWTLPAFPLLYPDVGEAPKAGRKQPVWNSVGGRRRFDCRLLCPPGAKLIQLPEGRSLDAGEGMRASVSLTASEEGGRLVLHSIVDYEIPLLVGVDRLSEYQKFLDALWALSAEVCLIGVPQDKSLDEM